MPEIIEKRHKVFVSYQHNSHDHFFKKIFVQNTFLVEKFVSSREDDFGNISPNLEINRIKQLIRERFLRDTTVTVVLVGKDTWKSKHIDWEISASLMEGSFESRSGLLGILLPSHPSFGDEKIDPFVLPPRLYDNVKHGYAKVYKWTDNPTSIQEWIHDAFINRHQFPPDNSRAEYTDNRIGGTSWKSVSY